MKTADLKGTLVRVAEQMVLAATTAPKGRGLMFLEAAIMERDDILRLAGEMEKIGNEQNAAAFTRDAGNLREHVQVAVLLGTRFQTLGLKYCGLCGFVNCADNEAHSGICVFNPGDLGIALGSAVSVAAQAHVDNRIMYTMGMAALSLQLLGPEVRLAFGIPLAATHKNPFFDRK
ncbi:MAG: DUF2148 domain-containing protein [candidate division FCPU426 bacterium]